MMLQELYHRINVGVKQKIKKTYFIPFPGENDKKTPEKTLKITQFFN